MQRRKKNYSELKPESGKAIALLLVDNLFRKDSFTNIESSH